MSDIPGVRLLELKPHPDCRGTLIEIFRQEWCAALPALQVNLTHSRAGTLRGVHVHGRHADYFVVAHGRAPVGLHDARRNSQARGRSELIELDAARPSALVVPVGIAHGVYFPVDSILVTVESCYYDPHEEIGCRWSDPALEIAWPLTHPALSDQDAAAPSYSEMLARLEPWQPGF